MNNGFSRYIMIFFGILIAFLCSLSFVVYYSEGSTILPFFRAKEENKGEIKVNKSALTVDSEAVAIADTIAPKPAVEKEQIKITFDDFSKIEEKKCVFNYPAKWSMEKAGLVSSTYGQISASYLVKDDKSTNQVTFFVVEKNEKTLGEIVDCSIFKCYSQDEKETDFSKTKKGYAISISMTGEKSIKRKVYVNEDFICGTVGKAEKESDYEGENLKKMYE